jgi:hypothetical protein
MKLLSSFPFYSRTHESRSSKLRVATSSGGVTTATIVNITTPCESEICRISPDRPKKYQKKSECSVSFWRNNWSDDSLDVIGDSSNDDDPSKEDIKYPQHYNIRNNVGEGHTGAESSSCPHGSTTSSTSSMITEAERDLSSLDSSNSTINKPRTVSFGNVHVREYSQTLGDHPLCETGCPLSLDWDYSVCESLTVDMYEESRNPCRRHRCDFRTTWEDRRRILCQDGNCTEGEIRRANRKIHRARSCGGKMCEKAAMTFFSDDVDNANS